jgi:cellobiose phosphorylase
MPSHRPWLRINDSPLVRQLHCAARVTLLIGPGRFAWTQGLTYWPRFLQRRRPLSVQEHEAPLRSELFSADQMEQHGRVLALSHELATRRLPDRLLARLTENSNALAQVCLQLSEVSLTARRVTPAGEWLLDNFHLIEEQIRTTRLHLPPGYSRELPRLARGPSLGHPRVYDIALEIISHGDGRIDREGLGRFVAAYQTVADLKLGELWAIPIMLRLAVIENLRRAAVRIAACWDERNLAESWADLMTDAAESDPKSLILVIADMARSNPPMVSSFVAELTRRLQGRGPALALPLTWIEQRLAESGCTIEQMVQTENQRQASDQLSVSNSIGSLRLLSAMNWRDFVETQSVVERILLRDPAGVYGEMDFTTRDRYRHQTEKLARKSQCQERDVARRAIELAAAAPGQGSLRTHHVGYFLIDRGLPALEAALRRPPNGLTAAPRIVRTALPAYLTAALLPCAAIVAACLVLVHASGVANGLLLPVALGVFLVASQLSLALVNWLISIWLTPVLLPRLDFSKGIPPSARTLVVVPTMLTSTASAEALLEALEVRFLANHDAHLHFALLTDFADAATENLDGDAALLLYAQSGIRQLNARYRGDVDPGDSDLFFLLHRPRCWNAVDAVWMGRERKRGKLEDLNAVLRTGDRSAFALVEGELPAPASVKYVITLDTDTQLPRDAARKMVGAMAHPLNRPGFDGNTRRITEGYAILQPRVAGSLPGGNRSRYARLYGGDTGIDPYTRASSDVYQDVFAEGSFIGKGIYDVDALEQVLGGRLPDNKVLSHDLLEGCYARSGLLSDVQLFEDYPSRYSVDIARRQRWIRGDWQLIGWLRRHPPQPPRAGAERQTNPLSALSRWKLFDNLRRSLVPAALTLLLLTAWALLPRPGLWTLALLSCMLGTTLCSTVLELLRKPGDMLLRQHIGRVGRLAARHGLQLAFELACLPYEAYFSIGAIVRTLWRLGISRRRLLEWNPSSAVESESVARNKHTLRANWQSMWAAPLVALTGTAYLATARPGSLPAAWPVLLLWGLAPVIAWWISLPRVQRQARISTGQIAFLRVLAYRTWRFFEHVITQDEHWLPPDNVQYTHGETVAHRTSPTNMGLALLANLTAYDFGYLTAGACLERSAQTLHTMEGLQRHRGHFYNWYDTQTLAPLPPLYISTVDSGNLAGHLLTLRTGLMELADAPVFNPRLPDGLSDALLELTSVIEWDAGGAVQGLSDEIAALRALPGTDLIPLHASLQRLVQAAEAILAQAGEPQRSDHPCLLLLAKLLVARDELLLLAPWLALAQRQAPAAILTELAANRTLRQIAGLHEQWVSRLAALSEAEPSRQWCSFWHDLGQALQTGSERANKRLAQIEQIAQLAQSLAGMEYDFLYDKDRHLLSIGYNVTDRRNDSGCYDLLASEARLGCFVAIAQGAIPQESWFALGRLLASSDGDAVLLSWSGSMFEYLMPLLVMPNYEGTLLDQTYRAVLARQIEYGRLRGVPWGISESGYNLVDQQQNYQYHAFGVPGLGLKRGLGEDLVIAPYASVMALMVTPDEACLNLQRLAQDGLLGTYGLFEAVDYSPLRQARGHTSMIVKSCMVHHQGMSLLALSYLLNGRPMQRRFEANPLFQASMLLLQERVPRAPVIQNAPRFDQRASAPRAEKLIRVFTTPDTPVPEVQLLSNGRYHVMVSNGGGGYSRWKDLAITRWQEDGTRDDHGSFCYIRDRASGMFWSTSHQPTRLRCERYEAIFSEGRAEFRRRDRTAAGDGSFETHTEIVVSPEDDIELRRVRVTNRSRQRREIEITSYAEVALAPPAAVALHPAFSHLFVETVILRPRQAILCTRRSPVASEAGPWMLHLMAVHGAETGEVSYETDRLQFIGRDRNAASPRALEGLDALSGSEGAVLDPVVAIRCVVVLEAEQSVTVDLVTGVAATRDQAESLVDKYQDRFLADRVLDLAGTHSQVVLRQLDASEAEAQLYARLANSVIHANGALRAEPELMRQNRRGQSGLWSYAISGDLPIVLVQISDAANIELVRQLVQAHAYWRQKGLVVDLVIWNEDRDGYRMRLQDQIMGLIASGVTANDIDRPGGIFVRSAEQISHEDRIMLQSVARAVIRDTQGTLEEQLDQRVALDWRAPRFIPSRPPRPTTVDRPVPLSGPRILDNGLGGFSPDGSEYGMTLEPGQTTPAPWVNVLANPQFGTVISASGSAYTWGENAHEFRLSPWHNDPVSDTGGEAIYLRDEETGLVWSPTPFPLEARSTFVVRHGFGYSVFETCVDGVHSELWVYVAQDAAVKFSLLKIRNQSGRARRVSATGFVEWVLGDLRAKSAMHVQTEIEPLSGALYARNVYNSEFAERIAFLAVSDPTRMLCGDRTEFLGRNGAIGDPAAMAHARLSGKVGAGLDPCAAMRVSFDLAEGQQHEVVFLLGMGRDADDAAQLIRRYRGVASAHLALDAVRGFWAHTVGGLKISTPDPAVNVLANGWLPYQILSSRLWARSGFYQSGGAYGFRDQLQDAMALAQSQPELLRTQVLLSASRQFVEGDVQHWWHPPSGRGVRTRCSDDLLWLPLAVCRYVTVSGDVDVLDEGVPFLDGRPISPGDESYYDLPAMAGKSATLYQHAVLAIRRALPLGEHGLPLIGSGDWNDGMNRVGAAGKGESVWLGFFLCHVIEQFAVLAQARGDVAFAAESLRHREQLLLSLEKHGWDGDWYRRAFFDDGTPLGSAANTECQIDSIAQSWSVLSGAGKPERARAAMQSLYQRLVRHDDQLVQLLDPPFDQSPMDPGYIRGYLPGIRENGGQYTQAAVWAAMAFARLNDQARAWELFAMINPVNHARTPQACARYKVEPYVICADVYAVAPHVGRGGWSWYTGSAGWMYRLLLESLLGLQREGELLHCSPCLPTDWPSIDIEYRYRATVYHLTLTQTVATDTLRIVLDGAALAGSTITLVDDGQGHRVEIRLPPAPA